MKSLYFSCQLLTDVILNQKAATEGPNNTLDFIPGSCFLGIAASQLYAGDDSSEEKKLESLYLFHSGHVRFGDAHPAYIKGSGQTDKGVRSLRVPASFYYPKLRKVSDRCYVHHRIPEFTEDVKRKQPKQCRKGFYAFEGKIVCEVNNETSFAVKSAYDRESRRAMDSQMYGYESLRKGMAYYFSVETDDESMADAIQKALCGVHRVGRSRSAQFGLVKISTIDQYPQVKSIPVGKGLKQRVEVYADSRLIFLDDDGMPTFQPSVEQLGLPQDSKILWDKSQVRTFQYSPWNYKRQCFDTDRCGIEKGSVLVVEVNNLEQLPASGYLPLSSYRNEGFGSVIYNPEFLDAEDSTGLSKLQWNIEEDGRVGESQTLVAAQHPLEGTPLLEYLRHKKMETESAAGVYSLVNEFVNNNTRKFADNRFASQWGTIRSIAMRYKTQGELMREIEKYLTHGVAKDKWEEKDRWDILKKFIESLTEENAQLAIVNLAAEMAKACKK